MRIPWSPILAALLALAAAAGPARSSGAAPPERLPAGHWSYGDLEELSVAGALDSLWLYVRPLSRGEVAAALLRGAAVAGGDPRQARLLREFAQEARELDPAQAPGFTRHLVDQRDGSTSLRAWPTARAGLSREPGRGWGSDALTQLGFQAAFLARPHWAVYSDMLARRYEHSRTYADPLFTDTDITFLTQQAYVAASFAPLTVALGRDRVRWGLGQEGSLILGDGADAMSLVEYSVDWRRLHATALTALLRPGGGEYLSGHRLEWRPARRWFVGLSEVSRYASKQPEPLYISGIIPYTLVQRLLAADDQAGGGPSPRNNIMVSLEGAWRPVAGVQLGATLLIDDLPRKSTQPAARTGYQANLLATRPRSARPATLRVEWTRIRNYVYSVFYGEDYIHHGSSLAYPLGPDLERLTGRVSVDLCPDVKAWVAADYLAKGEGALGDYLDVSHPGIQSPPGELQGVVEKTLRLDAGALFFARDNLQARGSLGWNRTRNAGHLEGVRRDEVVGALSLEGRW
ncbi:MAG: hypothetical protein HZB25_08640 [Candidatus Eisenbacteria bacterium]|nr:hypothetical protein [Candidatus Eisenbacteria bacterium]